MVSYDNTVRPRKAITTYGKPSRKRLAGHSHPKMAHRAPFSESPKTDPPSNHDPTLSNDENTSDVRQQSTGKVSSSKAQRVVSIYDMSLSDEEDPPLMRNNVTKSLQKLPSKPTIARSKTLSTSTDIKTAAGEDVRGNKRRKLSPVEQRSKDPPKVKAMPKTVLPSATSVKSKALQRASPKRQTVSSKSIVEPSPKKLLSRPSEKSTNAKLTPQSPSPSMGSIGSLPTKHISPKSTKLWNVLLDEKHGNDGDTSPTSDELSLDIIKPKEPQTTRTIYKPADPKTLTNGNPRRRLIDTLVEQMPLNIEEDDDSAPSGSESEDAESDDLLYRPNVSRDQSLAPELIASASAPASQGTQVLGPKVTYSRQRTMLVEEGDFMSQLALDMPLEASPDLQGQKNRRGSIPTLKPLSSFREEEESDDGAAGSNIKTIHELRQAGANSRFADEVKDLLDRIGSPASKLLSMRRSGLLDLANKMKDKSFVRQFRLHGAEQRLFLDMGSESDTVSGFLLISLLIPILSEGSTSLIIGQLQKQDIAQLLDRLVNVHKGIVAIVKERKTNMSKVAQGAISEYHDYLLRMPTWKDLQPVIISPCTLALRCLELMVRLTREAGDASDIISKELTSSLFEIMKSSQDDASWDLPNGSEAINFYLALSALESHSVAKTAQGDSLWLREYLPIVGHTLNTALKRPLDSFGQQQILALKLTLNVTNHNSKACDAIANADLMFTMARVTVAKFKSVANLWTEEEIVVAVDHLILLLGTMINFAAWSTQAVRNLDSSGRVDQDPIDDLTQLFVDNRDKTLEADSQHESQKNVPFGYLSVLLGYFCLLPVIEQRVRKRQTAKTLQPLITSIQEFIIYHKAADNEIAADLDGHSPHVAVTEQLESLVKKLLAIKVPVLEQIREES